MSLLKINPIGQHAFTCLEKNKFERLTLERGDKETN